MPQMNFWDSALIQGVVDGRQAFSAPQVVHMDITNICYNTCLGCWCRSPLLGDREMTPEVKAETLTLEVIEQFLDDLEALGGGVREIKLVGGGDPLMHPQVLDIVEMIKAKGFGCDINTQFGLFNERRLRRAVELGVDKITASVWCATPEMYVKTHPNQTPKMFQHMTNLFDLLRSIKRNGKPTVEMHNVVMNLNAHEVFPMLEYGLQYDMEEIQFVLMDPMPGHTDFLCIDDYQREYLHQTFLEMYSRVDPATDLYRDPATGKQIHILSLAEMIRRTSKESYQPTGVFDENIIDSIPCTVGWMFVRILGNGNVAPCCKGHRLALGNINKERFRDIWNGYLYQQFRSKAKNLSKTDPYFSIIGNDASKKTGCYNCDNLWQLRPMAEVLRQIPGEYPFPQTQPQPKDQQIPV